MYWFATQDWEGELPDRTAAEVKEEVQDLIRGWQGGIGECIDATDAEGISRSRLGDRWAPPQLGSAPNFTLAGDALHPMTPNLGQVLHHTASMGGTACADMGSTPGHVLMQSMEADIAVCGPAMALVVSPANSPSMCLPLASRACCVLPRSSNISCTWLLHMAFCHNSSITTARSHYSRW